MGTYNSIISLVLWRLQLPQVQGGTLHIISIWRLQLPEVQGGTLLAHHTILWNGTKTHSPVNTSAISLPSSVCFLAKKQNKTNQQSQATPLEP